MLLTTEIENTNQKILIVSQKDTFFLKLLKTELEKLQVELTVASEVPDRFDKFFAVFFVDFTDIIPSDLKKKKGTKFIFILFDNSEDSKTISSYCYDHHVKHIKVINLQSQTNHFKKDIETILWFTFSRTEDIFLHIYHEPKILNKIRKPKFDLKSRINKFITPKNLVITGVWVVVTAHLLFIPPLFLSGLFNYQAVLAIEKNQEDKSQNYTIFGKKMLEISESLFTFSKPAFHFFSIALPFEDFIQMNESINYILTKRVVISDLGTKLINGLFAKDKTQQEIDDLAKTRRELTVEITGFAENVQLLEAKIPEWTPQLKKGKQSLGKINEGIQTAISLMPNLDKIFAENSEKKYLILFANNMELRPGGGFIGSFAILKMKNYTIEDIKVFDVYDADGQLTAHIDPPDPISKYLNQTHWFLRDSAFTGDFPTDFSEAEKLLSMEIGEGNFDGAALVTVSGVQNILAAVKTLYIPDYKEIITGDNFYIKAQLYAEEDFFPGSREKKSFLSAVMNQLLLGVDGVSLPKLVEKIETSLDQKQIVLFSKDPALQDIFAKNYWSGQILKPNCTVPDAFHCIPDFLYQLDANLGVNKANFFIKRPIKLKVQITPEGKIQNTATFVYENNSYPNVFPGGPYKNYFQLLLPPNSIINFIKIDGENVEEYDETNFGYKQIGFLLTVPPQTKSQVTITYSLPTTIVKGEGIYQLILQKQIGTPNYDLEFEFKMPSNATITRNNLSPLAKDHEILYNTSVSSDRIFLIEFNK